MVERLHQQLKSSFVAFNNSNRVQVFLTVLLGLGEVLNPPSVHQLPKSDVAELFAFLGTILLYVEWTAMMGSRTLKSEAGATRTCVPCRCIYHVFNPDHLAYVRSCQRLITFLYTQRLNVITMYIRGSSFRMIERSDCFYPTEWNGRCRTAFVDLLKVVHLDN